MNSASQLCKLHQWVLLVSYCKQRIIPSYEKISSNRNFARSSTHLMLEIKVFNDGLRNPLISKHYAISRLYVKKNSSHSWGYIPVDFLNSYEVMNNFGLRAKISRIFEDNFSSRWSKLQYFFPRVQRSILRKNLFCKIYNLKKSDLIKNFADFVETFRQAWLVKTACYVSRRFLEKMIFLGGKLFSENFSERHWNIFAFLSKNFQQGCQNLTLHF